MNQHIQIDCREGGVEGREVELAEQICAFAKSLPLLDLAIADILVQDGDELSIQVRPDEADVDLVADEIEEQELARKAAIQAVRPQQPKSNIQDWAEGVAETAIRLKDKLIELSQVSLGQSTQEPEAKAEEKNAQAGEAGAEEVESKVQEEVTAAEAEPEAVQDGEVEEITEATQSEASSTEAEQPEV